METYNSQNLPLEHIVKNGRNFLLYKINVKNTKAKPANPNSPRAVDHYNAHEATTYFLDNETIEEIVKTVNKLNIPAVIEIDFDIRRQPKMSPITIPILPAVVEKNIGDATFVQRYIDYYDDKSFEQPTAPEGVDDLRYIPLDLAQERAKIPHIDIIESNQVVLVREQIRRLIIAQYLYAKSNMENNHDLIPIVELVEGLNIINNHYDLRNIDIENIHFGSLPSMTKTTSEPTAEDPDYPKTIYDFSIELQKKKQESPSHDVYCLRTPEFHVVGLRCGKDDKSVEENARFDALVTDRIVKMFKTESIIDLYKRKLPKNPEDFLPKQPGSN